MSYEVTPLRLEEHREALARIWAENMSDARIASVVTERLRWLYELAPDGPATTMVSLHAESGEVVGCGSFLPRTTWVDGRRLRGGLLCDFAVARAHRVAGAAISIQRALVRAGQAAGLDFLFGFPNERSLPIFKHVGYRVVGDATTWVKPLRSGYKLRERLRWRWATSAAAALVDVGLGALDRVRSMRTQLRVKGEVVPRADRRFDELWERVRSRQGLAGERTSSYLDWRYGRSTSADYSLFGVTLAGQERLVGYAVLSLRLGKAHVYDLFAEDRERAIDALLLSLADYLRAHHTDHLSLSYFGSPGFDERLRRLGFHVRPGTRPLILYLLRDEEETRARLLDPASWLMLDGELDV